MKFTSRTFVIVLTLLCVSTITKAHSNILPRDGAQYRDLVNSSIGGSQQAPITEPSAEMKEILYSKKPTPPKESDYSQSPAKEKEQDPVEKIMNSRDNKKSSWETQSAPTKWNADGVDIDRYKKSKYYKRYGYNPSVDNEKLYAGLEANDLNVPALIAVITVFLCVSFYILYKRKIFENMLKRDPLVQPTRSTELRHKKRELRDREREILLKEKELQITQREKDLGIS